MLRQEQIAEVINAQKHIFLNKETGLEREALDCIPIVDSYATIITGLRRCGKSTLLLQLLRKQFTDAIYLNFEDIRLTGFDSPDFVRFHNEIEKRDIKVLFLDEIQMVEKWDVFVHQVLREGYQVFITGSNASLLSRELGTHLTGRQISVELFPFSYTEFTRFKNLEPNEQSLELYMRVGGMPEYVKAEGGPLLSNLVDDILIRDISIRYAIRDIGPLRQLAVYLISNAGTLISAGKLTNTFGIKSSTTILGYLSFLSESYLVELLPQFSNSLKARSRNPKKVYVLDTGIISEVSTALTENTGHKLENLVYLHLRRTYHEIFFYKEKGECDFITFTKGKIREAVQVCCHVNDLNWEREYQGLLAAMEAFNLQEGCIVTLNQSDTFTERGRTIRLVPAHEYLASNKPTPAKHVSAVR